MAGQPKKTAAKKKTGAPKKAAAKPTKKSSTSSFRKALKNIQSSQATITKLFIGLAVVMVITYLLAVYAAFTTSFIPGKYLGLGFLASFVLTAGLAYALVKRGPAARYSRLVVVLALVGTVINLAVFSIGASTTTWLNSLQSSEKEATTQYAIVALKEKDISLDTPGQKISLLESDAIDPVKKAVTERTPAAIVTGASPTENLLSLTKNSTQMTVFTTAYLDQLRETVTTAPEQELEVLAVFEVKTPTNEDAVKEGEPFIVYISGIDTYGAVDTTSRSDVNLMAVVNPTTHKILFVNTPRDYYVQLAGTTGVKDKLTHAGLYGIDRSEATLEQLYGVSINYNVRINFTSLEKIVDTLGGVDVYSGYNFSSGGYTFKVGTNHLDGKAALAFSRERYSFDSGDRQRGQNQMQVLTALVEKMSQPATIVRHQAVYAALEGVIQTDMPREAIASLVRNQLDSMAKWSISTTSVDGTGASLPTYSMGAQRLYVMIPDETSLKAAQDRIHSTLGH